MSVYEEEFVKWDSMSFAQIRNELTRRGLPMPLRGYDRPSAREYKRKSTGLIEKILRMVVPLADQPFGRLLVSNRCFNIDDYEHYYVHEGYRNPIAHSPRELYAGGDDVYGGRFGFQLIDPNAHLYYPSEDHIKDRYATHDDDPRIPPCRYMYYVGKVWLAPL